MLGFSSFPFAFLLIACYMCFWLCAFADSVSGLLVLLLASNKYINKYDVNGSSDAVKSDI